MLIRDYGHDTCVTMHQRYKFHELGPCQFLYGMRKIQKSLHCKISFVCHFATCIPLIPVLVLQAHLNSTLL